MKPSSYILRFAVIALLTCISALAEDFEHYGVIQGVVLGPSGEPVAGARVKANFTASSVGIVPVATTDKSGHFIIRGLASGRWYVTASKEQDGYPDQSSAFYAGLSSHPVIVNVDATNPKHTVTVRLGRKAGLLVGTITDAATGEAVEPCGELRWKQNPSIHFGPDFHSTFRLLVPAATDITLALSAWGYDPWLYRNSNGGDSLRVQAGEQVTVHIRMTPNEDKNRQPTGEELVRIRQRIEKAECPVPLPR